MSKLLELAERCEAATGPDRELDLHIMRYAENIGGPADNAKPYTASLDAAMTLIDETVFFHVSRFSPDSGGGGQAHVYPNRGLGDDYEAEAATPALALCAAFCRARASIEGGEK